MSTTDYELAMYYLNKIVELLDDVSTRLGGMTFAEADKAGLLG